MLQTGVCGDWAWIAEELYQMARKGPKAEFIRTVGLMVVISQNSSRRAGRPIGTSRKDTHETE